MLKLCEDPHRSDADKARSARSKFNQMCSVADFIKFDSNIDDGYGPRYLKFSDKKEELKIEKCKKYFGEWSKTTN